MIHLWVLWLGLLLAGSCCWETFVILNLFAMGFTLLFLLVGCVRCSYLGFAVYICSLLLVLTDFVVGFFMVALFLDCTYFDTAMNFFWVVRVYGLCCTHLLFYFLDALISAFCCALHLRLVLMEFVLLCIGLHAFIVCLCCWLCWFNLVCCCCYECLGFDDCESIVDVTLT